MTVENQVVAQPESQADQEVISGLVLGTTKRVLGMYGQVKDLSPVLKTSLESVESRVPEALLSRLNTLSAASEPVLHGLDQRYDHLQQTLAKTVAGVSDQVKGWKDLRGDLTRKAVDRLERGLSGVQEFSATRGKDMIHVDLIEYSREVLDNAQASASTVLVPLTQRVATLVEGVRAAVAALQKAVVERSTQGHQKVVEAREVLRTRLEATGAAARELSAQAVKMVQAKYTQAVAALPDDERVEALAAKLPTKALQGSLRFILRSPAMVGEVGSKADLDSSKRAIDNITSLVHAVREVVFSPAGGHASVAVEPVPEAEEQQE